MANNNTAFVIDGHSYADAKLVFDGIELPGVTSFEFNVTQEKVNNYGTGKNPVSRSKKKVEYSGSMEIDYATIELMTGLAPTGLLNDVPAGVMIVTLEKQDGTKAVVTMSAFEFNADGVGGSEGDDNLKTSVDVIFGSFVKTVI